MRKKKQIRLLFLMLFLLLTGCGAVGTEKGSPATEGETAAEASLPEGAAEIGNAPGEENLREEDIVILFTGGIRGAAEGSAGWEGIAACREQMLAEGNYVLLADCGNHFPSGIQAQFLEPERITELMNMAGYDTAVCGTAELSGGLREIRNGMLDAEFPYTSCNLAYAGTGTDPFFGMGTEVLFTYGNTETALIGITAPETLTEVPSAGLEENGSVAVTLHAASEEEFYETVQQTVDGCRAAGADLVILLTCLGNGTSAETGCVTAADLIRNTEGVDAVLNGGCAEPESEIWQINSRGEKVLLSCSGAALSSVGKLSIRPDGSLQAELLTGLDGVNSETGALQSRAVKQIRNSREEKAGTAEAGLPAECPEGTGESSLGIFCAEALRSGLGAQIGWLPAEDLGSGFEEGSITAGDIADALPEDRPCVLLQVTGQQLLDALEMSCRKADAQGLVWKGPGESLPFQPAQISGLRYTVDLTVPSPVSLDEEERFAEIVGERRVREVMIGSEEEGWTEPDPEETYTLALPSALVSDPAMTMFTEEMILTAGPSEAVLLRQYITETLSGVIPASAAEQTGRVSVVSAAP